MALNINKRGFLERIARALEKARDEGLIGGGSVDSEMSDTSENAVQNKVIKEYVDQNAGGGSSNFIVKFSYEESGSGGGTSSTVLVCDKTYAEITEAYEQNKHIIGITDDSIPRYSVGFSSGTLNREGHLFDFCFVADYDEQVSPPYVGLVFGIFAVTPQNEIVSKSYRAKLNAVTITEY